MEYMNELLDSSMPQNKNFSSELLKKWQQLHSGVINDHHDFDDTAKSSHQVDFILIIIIIIVICNVI